MLLISFQKQMIVGRRGRFSGGMARLTTLAWNNSMRLISEGNRHHEEYAESGNPGLRFGAGHGWRAGRIILAASGGPKTGIICNTVRDRISVPGRIVSVLLLRMPAKVEKLA
jgi:hypothetical protein